VIWDSGASENMKGNRCTLFNFKELSKPIAVRVATDGPCNFITGMGTLKFAGMNRMTIVVKNVYYCEKAQSTLLSIAAFKKSNAHFQVGGNFNTINLLCANGRLLMRSNFDAWTNTWPVEKPFRAISPLVTYAPPLCNTSHAPVPEMNFIFKSPNNVETRQFTGNASNMTNNEKTLLFWHHLFGHSSLRQIRRLVKLKLGYGLPEQMPTGTIKCPVCSICKATRTSLLGPSNRSSNILSVVVVDLMGPFDPPTMTGGKYALTIRDTHTTYSKVKILKLKSEATKTLVDTITRRVRS
jgi:hypothetical protein